MFNSKVIFPNVSCITPFLQLMMALEVARKGLPRMIVCFLNSGLSIQHHKIHRIVEFVHLN